MFLLYVDESGDTGLTNSPTNYFVLTGLVMHELSWRATLDALIAFRKMLRQKYGLKLREEIHAQEFINSPGPVKRIIKSRRLQILRDVLDFEAGLADVNIISVRVDKRGKASNYDVLEHAWRALIQRFHNTISHRNFPGPANSKDHGLLIADQTQVAPLMRLTRRLTVYNPIPNMRNTGYRNLPIATILEDPVHRDSLHSYFVQCADVNSYFLFQKYQPSRYIKRKGAHNFFVRLTPVLCQVASTYNTLGIVEL